MKSLLIVGVILMTNAVQAQVDDSSIDEDTVIERIFNGEPAAEAQFPYQVALFVYPYFATPRFCGGSLISNEWVLTAAHCIYGIQRVTVVLGVRNLTNVDDFVQAESEKLVVYPWYFKPTLENDIALIKLQRGIQYTKRIQPINLPLKGEVVGPGETLTVSGWGKVDDELNSVSPILNYAEMKSISNQECRKDFIFLLYRKSTLCCVGKSKQSACSGDSGGPLIRNTNGKKTLVGVVSFGSKTGCSSGAPNGYTRVEPYLDWIRKITKL